MRPVRKATVTLEKDTLPLKELFPDEQLWEGVKDKMMV
jgi:hypothetical protein